MPDELTDLEKEGITELVALDVQRVDGVRSPASGAGFLLIKSVADDGNVTCKLCGGSGKIREGHVKCPDCQGSGKVTPDKAAAQKSDSQEADEMQRALTGEAAEGARCNGRRADGGLCGRPPVPGQTRCHLHQEIAKGDDAVGVADVVRKAVREHLENEAAFKAAAKSGSPEQLEEAGLARTLSGLRLEALSSFGVSKGAVQDALNGTSVSLDGLGAIASGGSGATGAETGGILPGIRTETPNGLPGVFGPLQGGQSPYTIPAEDRLNGGGGVAEGESQGLAALVRAASGRNSRSLPGEPANPQLVKAEETLAALVKARQALNAARDRGSSNSASTASRELEQAGEEATLAALRAHAMGVPAEIIRQIGGR